jgi:hypothetical protein
VSHTQEAEAKRSKTQLANHENRREWSTSDQPSWLTATVFHKLEDLRLRLRSLDPAIMAFLVSTYDLSSATVFVGLAGRNKQVCRITIRLCD